MELSHSVLIPPRSLARAGASVSAATDPGADGSDGSKHDDRHAPDSATLPALTNSRTSTN
jgi:hypothetical protein